MNNSKKHRARSINFYLYTMLYYSAAILSSLAILSGLMVIIVPDYYAYYQDIIDETMMPWWINVFFTRDAMGNLDPNMVFFITFAAILIMCLLTAHIIRKLVIKKRPKH